MNHRLFLTVCAAAALVPAGLFGQARRVVLQGAINEPGQYILPSDLQVVPSRGAGIMITASGVDLDMNGASLTGPGGVMGTGIHVRGASGVSIRNGKFANLGIGITVENSANVTISDVQIRGEGAIPSGQPETAIMILQSRNVVVTNNSIFNTGLGIFVRGGRSSGNRISDNTITAGTGFAALGICYNPAPGDSQGPKGDLITGNLVSNYPTAIQFNSTSAANVVKGNSLVYLVDALTTSPANLDVDNVKAKMP